MRISRLYTSALLATGNTIALDDEASHYARTVLRLKKNDAITLFNGHGNEYQCHITDIGRKAVTIVVNSRQERSVESPLMITLGLSISRGDRMDLSVQKTIELGANQITPLLTERCVVHLSHDKKQQRLAHWQKIVQHAVEQSGRTLLPQLTSIETLTDWLPQQHGLKVFLDPYATTTLTTLQPNNQHVTLLIGPEGGFSSNERDNAKAAGFIPVRLGQRILRTETASLAALAAVQMLWGDFCL